METATKEKALKRIMELVDQFDEGYDNYKKTTYDEAKTRGTFIDEYFKALGWDVHNKEGVDESYRDVIPEDKIKVEGRTKAPDYCFTIYGQRKFFVEAKKPSVPIKIDVASVFQIRRYGYHNKLPISIITNFEEFAIYDCTNKPFLTDKTSVGRIRHLNYKEYVKEFDFLWNTFSKESVLKGRYDKFVKSDTEKRGTSTVDTDFLVSLNEWRKYLASSVAKNNHQLTQEEVQYAVQQTIDRIIFLIFCEYKKVETWGNLKSTTKKGNLYKNLFELFNHADNKYNSGLFDFNKDQISEKLKVDNKVIDNIIFDLYPPNSDYDFSILPVEVLGSAYEQFLGKIIRITPGHIVKIEDKPEVKKAKGVFYTPQYIVDFIVKNTVGKLIQGKTPEQISKIKIVDPACGSGSFLLGAYQFLLNYHTDYYLKKGYQEKKVINNPLTPEGRLTTIEKRKILLNNIFGIDIDRQAVEVTKLSLLLKAMEGETDVSIKRQLQLIHERVLPNIDGNIKCGNSLIDYEFFNKKLELDKEENDFLQKKINPFDWESAFPDVFKDGGFDVVIGNPPYVFTRDVEWGKDVKDYFWENYSISNKNNKTKKNQSGKINLYILFILKATRLINEDGIISFIVPNGLLRTTTYDTTRKYLLENSSIGLIVDLKDGVFKGVTASTIIFQIGKFKQNNKTKIIDANYKQDNGVIKENNTHFITQNNFKKNVSYTFSIFSNDEQIEVFDKVKKSNKFLKDITKDIIEGIVAKKEFICTKKLNSQYKKFLEGKDIKRYAINFSNRYIIFDRKKLHRARPDYIWESAKKIIIQRISGGDKPLVAVLDKENYYSFASTNLLLIKNEFENIYSYELVCALLNSNLINYFYSKSFTNNPTLTVNISKTFLEMIPLPEVNSKTKSIIVEIEKFVYKAHELHSELKENKTSQIADQIENRIAYTEKKINELVYELYDLSKNDIDTIENNLQ